MESGRMTPKNFKITRDYDGKKDKEDTESRSDNIY